MEKSVLTPPSRGFGVVAATILLLVGFGLGGALEHYMHTRATPPVADPVAPSVAWRIGVGDALERLDTRLRRLEDVPWQCEVPYPGLSVTQGR